MALLNRTSNKEPLHVRLRPKTLDEVIGQDAIVASLRKLNPLPRSFLFTGPSGVGKTTLARIIASILGCAREGILEIDGARHSGVENMRSVVDMAQYRALGDNPRKMIIVDEAHAISANAWKSLLKAVEEPPAHVYWTFCTTEPDKVPSTIRTRCHTYDLKPVKWDTLADYLEDVTHNQELGVHPDLQPILARKANGSVRQALVYLSMVNGIDDKAVALRLLEEFEDQQAGPIAIARMVVSGKSFSWGAASELLVKMQDVSAETIRLTIINYAAAAISEEKDEKKVVRLLNVIQTFSSQTAYNASEKFAPLYLAIGSLLYSE